MMASDRGLCVCSGEEKERKRKKTVSLVMILYNSYGALRVTCFT